MFFGVCGGVAKYFGVDATLVRILAAILAIFGFGTPILIYIIMMFIMPKEA
jgi:phage shock protein PspC (stress-responsive transcriptional regulator)